MAVVSSPATLTTDMKKSVIPKNMGRIHNLMIAFECAVYSSSDLATLLYLSAEDLNYFLVYLKHD